MATYTRSDQLLTMVHMDGQHLGVFSNKSGGDATADNTKIRPGAMSPEVSLGGQPTYEDLTISRPYDPFRDDPLAVWMLPRVGKARVIVSVVALDGNGAVFKSSTNPYWVGRLTGVSSPDADAGSGEAAMLELTISVTERG